MSHIDGMIQLELASPFDLFGVSAIEVAEDIQTTPDREFTKDDRVVDGLFDGPVGLVEGVSDFVDPPLSFDVLSGFLSCFDDVHDSSFMDLSIFEYLSVSCDITLCVPFSPISQIFDIDYEIVQYNSNDDSSSIVDSDPIDQRVSPATGDAEVVDFGAVDQPMELRIGLDLSTNEKDGHT